MDETMVKPQTATECRQPRPNRERVLCNNHSKTCVLLFARLKPRRAVLVLEKSLIPTETS